LSYSDQSTCAAYYQVKVVLTVNDFIIWFFTVSGFHRQRDAFSLELEYSEVHVFYDSTFDLLFYPQIAFEKPKNKILQAQFPGLYTNSAKHGRVIHDYELLF